MKGITHKLLPAVLLLILFAVCWKLYTQREANGGKEKNQDQIPVPVEVGDIRRGSIEEIRVFSGSVEPAAALTLSSKVSGRVLNVFADISDPVKRDQILVELEPEEFAQQLARAEAEQAVAEAQLQEAENRLKIAKRERERMQQLRERGISSAAAEDSAESEFLIRSAALAVAKANLTAAESAVDTAKLQLGETRIRARWREGHDHRFISARSVEEGDTVSPGQHLLTLVEIQPVLAVIDVPEKDYGRLSVGQAVNLTTDAWPGKTFAATIQRISPVFREESRQARVEIKADNPDLSLKPGMFIRAAIVLDHVDDAILVPQNALSRRGNETGLFTVDSQKSVAHWQKVVPGIRDGKWVQIVEPEITGPVVTLGQQLIDEGSALRLPDTPE
ncbi:efflux RND transporter periplasmic adaptor subunit [Kiritimatiellaeota bacterium B1221]|nr:efflux RND transporter periplasmic adaptor subunit [Kiritimatiellaeota bacterium B1221]